MSDQKPLNMNIGDLGIMQLGYVYKDVEKQANIMEQIWGMPKFAIFPDETTEVIYRGKKSICTLKIALSRYFGKQIELIQPISGAGIHQEFLDNGHEGLQHISCMVEDLDPYIEVFKRHNIEAVFIGHFWKQYVAYFDTIDSLGILLELQMTKKRSRK
jgi:hypothetical protein